MATPHVLNGSWETGPHSGHCTLQDLRGNSGLRTGTPPHTQPAAAGARNVSRLSQGFKTITRVHDDFRVVTFSSTASPPPPARRHVTCGECAFQRPHASRTMRLTGPLALWGLCPQHLRESSPGRSENVCSICTKQANRLHVTGLDVRMMRRREPKISAPLNTAGLGRRCGGLGRDSLRSGTVCRLSNSPTAIQGVLPMRR